MVATASYENLVQSASRLTASDALAEFKDHNVSDAARLAEQNRLVLESARHMLGQKCRVPLRYERSFIPDHADDFSHLRNLARAFRVEAILAASREDFTTVALVGVDVLELANAVRRGGLVIDLLVGVAISGVAMDLLRKIRGKVDESTRLTLRDALQRLENEREPFADIYARDQIWKQTVGYEQEICDFTSQELMAPHECGLSKDEQMQLLQFVQSLADLPESDQRDMQQHLDGQAIAMTRMLSVDLALRSWYASTASLPSNLTFLTPRYLPELPVDPFTGGQFVYRPLKDDSFLLYSMGPTSTDCGGIFGPWISVAAGCADLCLDANDYWQDSCTVRRQRKLVSRISSALRSLWCVWRR